MEDSVDDWIRMQKLVFSKLIRLAPWANFWILPIVILREINMLGFHWYVQPIHLVHLIGG